MFHERQVTGGDGAINLAQGPAAGPPLLFLHGVGRSWQDFVGLLTDLASRWQVIAIDFRGHGLSARTSGKYLVRDYLRDVLAVAGHLDQPLVLYGHSLGGMVAGLAAAELGEQVRGAILEDPPYHQCSPGGDDAAVRPLFSLLQSVSGSPLEVSELARTLADSRLPSAGKPNGVRLGDLRDVTSIRLGAACLKRVDPAVWDPVLAGNWLSGTDFRMQLAKIACPVLLLQGNVDLGGMVGSVAGDDLERLIPDCYRLHWQDVGHLIHNLLPERTLRVVREFLDSIALDPRGFPGR